MESIHWQETDNYAIVTLDHVSLECIWSENNGWYAHVCLLDHDVTVEDGPSYRETLRMAKKDAIYIARQMLARRRNSILEDMKKLEVLIGDKDEKD